MQHSIHHYAVNQRSVLNTSHYRDILYVLQFEKPEFTLFLGRFENLKFSTEEDLVCRGRLRGRLSKSRVGLA